MSLAVTGTRHAGSRPSCAKRSPGKARAGTTPGSSRGATDDYASFRPYLERNLELKRRYVECFEWSDSPYTPLLDDYEPGMLTTEVREVFALPRPALTELVASAPEIDASFLHGDFAADDQRAFAEQRARDARLRRRGLAARPDRASRPARRPGTGTSA